MKFARLEATIVEKRRCSSAARNISLACVYSGGVAVDVINSTCSCWLPCCATGEDLGLADTELWREVKRIR